MNEAHVADYLRRTGDEEIITENYTDDPQKGFVTYQIKPEALVIGNLYGDGSYWLRLLAAIARANGKEKMMGVTRRLSRAKAFERRHGFKIVGYVLERGVTNGKHC